MSKKFYIHTLGCKVNQYESQAMREILSAAGFSECSRKEPADIYVINTCTVTHHADRESRYWIGYFHRANPKAKIVATGCYVEKDSDEITSLPGVSHIIKNKDKSRIAEILDEQRTTNNEQRNRLDQLSISSFKGHNKAFVKIQDGCENSCSYCKVPLVRGYLKSRPVDSIISEVETLAANGFREIILTGICLGAWGVDLFPAQNAREAELDAANLVDALKAIDKVKDNFRIRLSSIEPKYVTDELIEYIAGNKRICRHLHIPLQSGDDEILKRMNRPYSTKDYAKLLDKVRAKIKDVAVTTDVMAGFPGETDRHFSNTVNFLKTILPARTHIFSYSKRKGTAAYGMGGGIKNDVMRKRHCKLDTLAVTASYLYRKRFLNRALDVLVEERRDQLSGRLMGYSDNYIKVCFDGSDDLAGKIIPVRIENVNMMNTTGVIE
jgi:threonylcarbamoyladenosine tRNA methylthiotransferase MtaB